MTTYNVNSIGVICNNEPGTFIKLNAEFIPALKALNGFIHIKILQKKWFFFYKITNTPNPYCIDGSRNYSYRLSEWYHPDFQHRC